jgi:hypothetical protein
MGPMLSQWILGGRSKAIGLALFGAATIAISGIVVAVPAEPHAQPACTASNAKPVTFRYAEKYATVRVDECVTISGYVYGAALHRSKAVATSNDEPGWQTIGIWRPESGEGGDPAFTPDKPRKAVIIGQLEDCGTKLWPRYCHYIGGTIINVTDVRFMDGK